MQRRHPLACPVGEPGPHHRCAGDCGRGAGFQNRVGFFQAALARQSLAEADQRLLAVRLAFECVAPAPLRPRPDRGRMPHAGTRDRRLPMSRVLLLRALEESVRRLALGKRGQGFAAAQERFEIIRVAIESEAPLPRGFAPVLAPMGHARERDAGRRVGWPELCRRFGGSARLVEAAELQQSVAETQPGLKIVRVAREDGRPGRDCVGPLPVALRQTPEFDMGGDVRRPAQGDGTQLGHRLGHAPGVRQRPRRRKRGDLLAGVAVGAARLGRSHGRFTPRKLSAVPNRCGG